LLEYPLDFFRQENCHLRQKLGAVLKLNTGGKKEYNIQDEKDCKDIVTQLDMTKNHSLLGDVNTGSIKSTIPFLQNTCTSSISLSEMAVWSGDRSVFETLFLAISDKDSGCYWCSSSTFVIDWEIFGSWVRRGNVAPRNDSIRRRLQNYHFRTVKRLPGPDVQEWEHTEGFCLGSHCDFESSNIFADPTSKKKKDIIGSMKRRKGAPESRKHKGRRL